MRSHVYISEWGKIFLVDIFMVTFFMDILRLVVCAQVSFPSIKKSRTPPQINHILVCV